MEAAVRILRVRQQVAAALHHACCDPGVEQLPFQRGCILIGGPLGDLVVDLIVSREAPCHRGQLGR